MEESIFNEEQSAQKIIFIKGIIGSGKTTWSKQYCVDNPNFVRINKDDIREMLGNPEYTKESENDVVTIQHKMAETILRSGKSLIVDDTNFNPYHQVWYRGISDRFHIDFTIKIFNTPLEECIARDATRGNKSIGEGEITKMYNKYKKDII